MARKKKPVRVGLIRKEDLLKHSRERDPLPMKVGPHITEADRPRKKFHSEKMIDEELYGDYDDYNDDDDFDLEP